MRLATLVALACLAGCQARTELMLIVKAAPGLLVGPGADIDALRVEVQPTDAPAMEWFYTRSLELCPPDQRGTASCRPQQYADPDYDGALTLPVRFLLIPGEQGGDGEVRVWIDALKTGYGQPRLANGVKFKFAHGRRLWLEVPLYRQCLDDLTCEALDEVCNKDRDCQALQPSTTEPPIDPTEVADLSGADVSIYDDAFVYYDLPPPPDLAHSCGQSGGPCCDMACTSGTATCTSGFCVDSTITCGQVMQGCCGDMSCLMSNVCNGSNTCQTACGANGQTCCTSGSACLTGQCFDMTCASCGSTNDICCPGGQCGAGNNCVGNQCQACGNLDQPVCMTGSPCSGSLVPTGGFCKMPCGGTVGATCCTGSDGRPTCNLPDALTCEANNTLAFPSPTNTCAACGSSAGAPCCQDTGATAPCQGGLTCISGFCQVSTMDMTAVPCDGGTTSGTAFGPLLLTPTGLLVPEGKTCL